MSATWPQVLAAMLLTALLAAPEEVVRARGDATTLLHRAVRAAKTLVLVHLPRPLPRPATRTVPKTRP